MLKYSRTAVLSILTMIVILVVMSVFKDQLQPQSSPVTKEHHMDTKEQGSTLGTPAAILP